MTSFDLNVRLRHRRCWARIYQAGGPCVPVRPDQHRRLRGPAAREEQQRLGPTEPVPQHRRQLRHLPRRRRCSPAASQFHQNMLIHRYSQYNPSYGSAVSEPRPRTWPARRVRGCRRGMGQARGVLTSVLLRQAPMLSYIDVFFVLAVSAAVMVPLVMMMKSNKPGGGGAAHHPPLSGALGEVVEEDPRRHGDVERIGAHLHRDGDPAGRRRRRTPAPGPAARCRTAGRTSPAGPPPPAARPTRPARWPPVARPTRSSAGPCPAAGRRTGSSGRWKIVPIDTRTDCRQNGSWHRSPRIIASAPKAAEMRHDGADVLDVGDVGADRPA